MPLQGGLSQRALPERIGRAAVITASNLEQATRAADVSSTGSAIAPSVTERTTELIGREDEADIDSVTPHRKSYYAPGPLN